MLLDHSGLLLHQVSHVSIEGSLGGVLLRSEASFTRQRSEHNPQKWRCVPTFYFAFRRASLGGNLHAHGDAKVCEI